MSSARFSKSRDLGLIILSFLVVFGCGFWASRAWSSKNNHAPPPVVADTEWESAALKTLKQRLNLSPEQEKTAYQTLQKTQSDLNDTRERALLEYYLHLLKTHDRLAPILNADQQAAILKSRKELEISIRNKFPHFLEENQLVEP